MVLPSSITTAVIAACLLLFHCDPISVGAFSTSVKRHRVTTLFVRHDGLFDDDIEAARQRLEDLVGVTSEYQQPRELQRNEYVMTSSPTFVLSIDSSLPAMPAIDVSLPPVPPLTTIERERRVAEIALISQLIDGDEGLADVQTLWSSERGSKAEALLREADELTIEGPQAWKEAEDILRLLIEEHGAYFVEPVNRLATLHYLQGRLEEALHFTRMVLKVKPWHIQALSRIVMIYAGLGDSETARRWAAHRLPSFSSTGSNRRRARWVERAVLDAHTALNDAERRLVDSFGISDRDWITVAQQKDLNNDEVTAWQ